MRLHLFELVMFEIMRKTKVCLDILLFKAALEYFDEIKFSGI